MFVKNPFQQEIELAAFGTQEQDYLWYPQTGSLAVFPASAVEATAYLLEILVSGDNLQRQSCDYFSDASRCIHTGEMRKALKP